MSATETVKVEESKDDMDMGVFGELRHANTFQVVTKLHNFITSNQQSEMKRTNLNRRPTVTSEGRSEDGKQT